MKNYTITVNGNTYDVTVEEGGAGSAAPAAAPKAAAKAAPKAAPAAPKASGAKGSVKITAPMPGKILGLKANAGDTVKKGQAIIILEAMKMENEIVAPQDGKIASMDVAVGASVEAGDLLASME
ncbi:MAG: acetyl-CoA carboxylase biotin carboxyl carrier protein subunit [Lachnospiraceae bacterium]|nr:acetyl-CoA carboxylase biotin carboxyl carrier protein subunit [Lachnospiraceae bacterium]